MDRVTQSVRAAAWEGLRSQSAVVRFPAIIESFFGVIAKILISKLGMCNTIFLDASIVAMQEFVFLRYVLDLQMTLGSRFESGFAL